MTQLLQINDIKNSQSNFTKIKLEKTNNLILELTLSLQFGSSTIEIY